MTQLCRQPGTSIHHLSTGVIMRDAWLPFSGMVARGSVLNLMCWAAGNHGETTVMVWCVGLDIMCWTTVADCFREFESTKHCTWYLTFWLYWRTDSGSGRPECLWAARVDLLTASIQVQRTVFNAYVLLLCVPGSGRGSLQETESFQTMCVFSSYASLDDSHLVFIFPRAKSALVFG